MTGSIYFTIIIISLNYATGINGHLNRQLRDEDSEPYKPMPPPVISDNEKSAEFWKNSARKLVEEKLSYELKKNKAKNIIFFIGDGLSVSTITAARIYQGQLKNSSGEENKLFLESFPITGFSKTYCTNKQVADSACSATAYMTGVKGNFMTIGVTANVEVGDCEAEHQASNQVASIIEWAQEAGKATGIVTTTKVTHASPAGSYAHTCYRNFESDADVIAVNADPKKCDMDIAKQLVYQKPGKFIKVVLGGGRVKFLPNTTKDVSGINGERLDGDNLIDSWLHDKRHFQKQKARAVFNRQDLLNVNPDEVDSLLGLFNARHLNYHLEANAQQQPTLSEMTQKAIEVLKKEKNGFYLFVEGGKIDIAHHYNLARIALDETVEMVKAVQTAAEMTDERDTLIVVTADHSHVMTMSGYPDRGHSILTYYGKDKDNLTYPTLSYANGPGYHEEKQPGLRHDFTKDNFSSIWYPYPAMIPKEVESHGGDDVAVFARGPWAHLFSGTYEQSYIPMAEAYAAGIGPYHQDSSSVSVKPTNVVQILSAIIIAASYILS